MYRGQEGKPAVQLAPARVAYLLLKEGLDFTNVLPEVLLLLPLISSISRVMLLCLQQSASLTLPSTVAFVEKVMISHCCIHRARHLEGWQSPGS